MMSTKRLGLVSDFELQSDVGVQWLNIEIEETRPGSAGYDITAEEALASVVAAGVDPPIERPAAQVEVGPRDELEILPTRPGDQIGPPYPWQVEPDDNGYGVGPFPGDDDGMPTTVSGGALEGASEFWEEHKNKIMIGGGVLAAVGLWFKFRK